MKLSHITISVRSMKESLCFYRDIISLPVKRQFSTVTGLEIAFLGNTETEIELIYNSNQGDIFIGQDISLGFEVVSIQETIKFLHQNHIITSEVSQPNPQAKFFFASDPNGVKIQFIEYIK